MSTYQDRVNQAKGVFEKNGIEEARFWQLVKMADWPRLGCDKPRKEYLEQLTPKEGKAFRGTLDDLQNILDKFIGDRNPARGGDDAHSDFMYHIIGEGDESFDDAIKSYEAMELRGDEDDYVESFCYCVPYIQDWDNVGSELAEVNNAMATPFCAECDEDLELVPLSDDAEQEYLRKKEQIAGILFELDVGVEIEPTQMAEEVAHDLAEQILRFLGNEPEHRRPSVKIKKWVRDGHDGLEAQVNNAIKMKEERDRGVVHKSFRDIVDEIEDVLGEADGEFVAEIYNKVCSNEIEYVEDSLWKVLKD